MGLQASAMTRRRSKEQEQLADDAYLLRAWKKFHDDELAAALAGPHREVMSRLMALLKDLYSARELVAFIESVDWGEIDCDTQLVALHEINQAICSLRERMDQPPIEDALPGEPPRAYQVIREIINPVSRISGEAEVRRISPDKQ
jgi:hypothetical protein